MPLAVGNKPLSDFPKDDEHVRWYLARIAELKTVIGTQVDIVFSDKHIKPRKEGNQKPRFFGMWCSESIARKEDSTGGITETWTYYERIGNDGKFLPYLYPFNGQKLFDLDGDDVDLLIFMVFISPGCEPLPELKHQNPKKTANRHWKINNRKIIDKEEDNFNKKKAELYFTLQGLPVEVLRSIAEKEFEVQSVNRLNETVLRNTIMQKATATKQTFENLDISKYSSHLTGIKVLMESMIRANLLDYDKKKYYWRYKQDNGAFDESDEGKVLFIGTIKEQHDKKETRLIEHLLEHPEVLEVFRKKLNDKKITVEA
jgi:hypothetical protein